MLPKKNEHIKRSRLQERRGASLYGGTVNAGSGNQWMRKNDIRTPTESIEMKTTTKHSFSLKAVDLQKTFEQALLDNRIGVFEVEFADDGLTVVILDKSDYLELREKASGELNSHQA